jgi:P pilus assembly chaperone PapD
MYKRILYCFAALLLLTGLTVSAHAAMVTHGKCVSYDQDKKVLTIEEFDTNYSKENKYGKSTGKQAVFDVAEALIGMTPRAGDMVRIAFQEKDGKKSAIRIMNVTRQDLMKK